LFYRIFIIVNAIRVKKMGVQFFDPPYIRYLLKCVALLDSQRPITQFCTTV